MNYLEVATLCVLQCKWLHFSVHCVGGTKLRISYEHMEPATSMRTGPNFLAFPPSPTSFCWLLAVSPESSQVENVWGLMCCFNYFVLICIILDVDMCLWIKFLFTLIYEKGHCILGCNPNLCVLFFFTQTLTAIAGSKLSLSKDILLPAFFAVLWPTQDVFAETKCVWAHAYKTHNVAMLSQKNLKIKCVCNENHSYSWNKPQMEYFGPYFTCLKLNFKNKSHEWIS